MATPRTLVPLLVVAGSCLGQVSPTSEPTTRFGGHVVGETFDQWMTTNQLDLAEICGPHDKKDRRMDFKTVCSTLTELRSGKAGQFPTVDPSNRRIDWYFEGSRVSAAEMVVSLFSSSAGEQISFLKELYGPPTKVDTVHNSNLLGGTWDTLEASWEMPDGALIMGVETLHFNSTIGTSRMFTVYVVAKGDGLRKPKPNPYGPR
jgi:hypothetical protein